MAKKFSESETKLIQLFENISSISWKNVDYNVECAGKPRPSDGKGEPKTDLYLKMASQNGIKEIKISFKQSNANFIENKTSDERAREIFGDDWQEIILASTMEIVDAFEERMLIFKDKFGNTEAGSYVLGWRYELLNVDAGKLSGDVELSTSQLIDVYSGTNLSEQKKNSIVKGKVIENSGVANYILMTDQDNLNDCEQVLNSLQSIEDYITIHDKLYFACKASNFRSEKGKIEGNRYLAVYVNWFNNGGKLDAELIFDEPLKVKTKDALTKLKEALDELNISTVNDLNENNTSNDVLRKIYCKED